MLRSAFLVFIAGWVIWYWIDKPPAGQSRMPQASDSLVENFQRSFDILKAGHLDMAFLYIWNAHYLILSLLGGALVAVVYNGLSDYLSRKRMRKHFVPPPRVGKPAARDDSSPESGSGPAE
jgi:hypothetical protein